MHEHERPLRIRAVRQRHTRIRRLAFQLAQLIDFDVGSLGARLFAFELGRLLLIIALASLLMIRIESIGEAAQRPRHLVDLDHERVLMLCMVLLISRRTLIGACGRSFRLHAIDISTIIR